MKIKRSSRKSITITFEDGDDLEDPAVMNTAIVFNLASSGLDNATISSMSGMTEQQVQDSINEIESQIGSII